MKRRVCVLALFLLTFVLVGCKKETPVEETSESAQTLQVSPGDKAIVVYFSRTGEQMDVGAITEGNTAIVAKMIAAKTGAELFELTPKVDKYHLAYKELAKAAKLEQDSQARPEYAEPIPDLSQYDVIFFGAPVWWGDWPMIMYTLFEKNELQGKKIVPFNTHAGSELARFDIRLSKIYPYSNILQGLSVLGANAQNKRDEVSEEVDNWLKTLGFELKAAEDAVETPVEETAQEAVSAQ